MKFFLKPYISLTCDIKSLKKVIISLFFFQRTYLCIDLLLNSENSQSMKNFLPIHDSSFGSLKVIFKYSVFLK